MEKLKIIEKTGKLSAYIRYLIKLHAEQSFSSIVPRETFLTHKDYFNAAVSSGAASNKSATKP